MGREPCGGEACDFIEHPRFLEQVRRARHDDKLMRTPKLIRGVNIQVDDHVIAPAHDKQRRRLHCGELNPGQIRSTTA